MELEKYAERYEDSIKAEVGSCFDDETKATIDCIELFVNNVNKALDDLKNDICVYMEMVANDEILHAGDIRYNRFRARDLNYRDIAAQGEEVINQIALDMGVAFIACRMNIQLKLADDVTYDDKVDEGKTYDFKLNGCFRWDIDGQWPLKMVGGKLAQALASKLTAQAGPYIEIIKYQIDLRKLTEEATKLEDIVEKIRTKNRKLVEEAKNPRDISYGSSLGSYLEATGNWVNHEWLKSAGEIFVELSEVNSNILHLFGTFS